MPKTERFRLPDSIPLSWSEDEDAGDKLSYLGSCDTAGPFDVHAALTNADGRADWWCEITLPGNEHSEVFYAQGSAADVDMAQAFVRASLDAAWQVIRKVGR